MSAQPKWKMIANLGDVNPIDHGGYFVYVDETHQYDPQAELVEVIDNEITGKIEWWTYRFDLPQCSATDYRVSDNPFHPDKPAWFDSSLDGIAGSIGKTRREFVYMLCSPNVIDRAIAYREIYAYHGPQCDPLVFNRRADVSRRYRAWDRPAKKSRV